MIKDMKLETQRLIIRPYREEDLEECFHLMQDKELFHYLNMSVMPFDEYSDLFHWLIECYDVDFNGDFKYSFNVVLKETGKHIGWVGIGGADFDHADKEIYWLIGREFQNHGYASEAATALLEYGFTFMELNEIRALCKPENVASEKVMKKVLSSGALLKACLMNMAFIMANFDMHLQKVSSRIRRLCDKEPRKWGFSFGFIFI